MIIRSATQIGDQAIRKKSLKVTKCGSLKVQKIIKDLTDSMRYHQLVGMAAPQIGSNLRIFVTELRKTVTRKSLKQLDGVRVYINPRLVQVSKKQDIDYEGCGSVAKAKLFAPVRRPSLVTVQAMNEFGQSFRLKASGLLARVIQHETDHLNGVVFLDRVKNFAQVLDRKDYIRKKR